MSERLRGEPRKVLIVDDSLFDREKLAYIFKRKGIEVVAVRNVGTAKEALKGEGITEVITDGLKNLRGGDWKEVVKYAKEKGLLVRLLSGDREYQKAAEEMGVPFLDKGEVSIKDLVGE